MEPTPSTATLIDPASVPSLPTAGTTPAVPGRAFAGEPLPPKIIWAAVVVAAVLPGILLLTLLMCVWSENFNLFTWME